MAKTLKIHSKGKDLPRYGVVVGYEKEFKMEYVKELGLAITKIIKCLNDPHSISDTGINQNH